MRFLRGGWREVPSSASTPSSDGSSPANGDASANGDATANANGSANGNANGNATHNGNAKSADTYPGGRWWEDALGGPIEETRAANMVALDGLRAGMDAVRAMG